MNEMSNDVSAYITYYNNKQLSIQNSCNINATNF